jgi:hypothetical protein
MKQLAADLSAVVQSRRAGNLNALSPQSAATLTGYAEGGSRHKASIPLNPTGNAEGDAAW